jgi:hypothetical protein
MAARRIGSKKPSLRTSKKTKPRARAAPASGGRASHAAVPVGVAPPATTSLPAPPVARPAVPGPSARPPAPTARAGTAAWVSVAVIAVVLGGIAFGMPVLADEGNRGTIKVHDEEEASPAERNEPHVDCEDFWVEGMNMSGDAGQVVFYSWPPTGDKVEMDRVNWSADGEEQEGGGFHFLEGPFMFEAGHYRVEVSTSDGHPGVEEHFAKAKMFWVEPCESETVTSCPTDLVAASSEDGGFVLSWTVAEGSDGTNLYRAVGEEEFEFLAFVPADEATYHDEEVDPGVTYTYTVTGLFGDEESTGCAEVMVSMIPDFPSVFAMGAATLAAVGAYAFVARRRR